jgi:ParB-like chromosome segregation protein Spo0J
MTMQIEYWPLDRLLPYGNNPRKNDHAVERVAAAIREFGFRVPVVIRGEGEVVDGHLRLKAARHLGMEQVPVVRADDMTDAQVKAFRISVNRMAELAAWDVELLRVELEDLRDMDFDLDLTGLDAFKLLDDGLGETPEPGSGPDKETTIACPKCGYRHAL